MFIQKRRIAASEDVNVATEAVDMLFEAEDVAELVAEVTGEPVEVSVDDDQVVFSVADDTFTVTPEGDEVEVMESTRRPRKCNSAKVAASRKPAVRKRPVAASTTRRTRPLRKLTRR